MMNDERTLPAEKRDLKNRTRQFALMIVRFYVALPKSQEHQVLGRQVLRSGTSVGAHYREATRARSTAEFVSKIEVGLQELEETMYWLELLQEFSETNHQQLQYLLQECDELIRIFVTSTRTAKKLN